MARKAKKRKKFSSTPKKSDSKKDVRKPNAMSISIVIAYLVALTAIVVAIYFTYLQPVTSENPEPNQETANEDSFEFQYQSDPQIDNFVSWVTGHHDGKKPAWLGPIKIVNTFGPQGRIVLFSEDVKRGDRIANIPMDFVFSNYKAANSKIGKEVKRSGVQMMFPDTIMVVYLLSEWRLGDASWWKPYLDILPTAEQLMSIPLFMELDDFDFIQNTYTFQEIKRFNDTNYQEYTSLKRAIPSFTFSWAEYSWAKSAMMSRIFDFSDLGGRADITLLPVGEMFNHQTGPDQNEITYYNYDAACNCIQLTHHANGKKGHEAFVTYGQQKSVTGLYIQYGFAYERQIGRPQNYGLLELLLSIDPNNGRLRIVDPDAKRHPADTTKSTVTQDRLATGLCPGFVDRETQRTFSFLRLWHSQNGREFTEQNIRLIRASQKIVPFTSVSNEISVLEHLAKLVEQQLGVYDSTMQEDLELLEDKEEFPDFSTARSLLVVRISEKEVLHFYKRFSSEILRILKENVSRRQFRKYLKDNRNILTDFEPYINGVLKKHAFVI